MTDFFKTTLDDWRTSAPAYDGNGTEEILETYLDYDYGSLDAKLPLLLDDPIVHIHEAFMFNQFIGIARGEWTWFPVFYDPEFAPHILHMARKLRANTLASLLEKNLNALAEIPSEVIRKYLATATVKDTHPEYHESLKQIFEFGYRNAVKNGEVLGAIEAPVSGDSGVELKDALASYLEAIRVGRIVPDIYPISDKLRETLLKEKSTRLNELRRGKQVDSEQIKLEEKYLSQGHGTITVFEFLYGSSHEKISFLDSLAEKGVHISGWFGRTKIHGDKWQKLRTKYYKLSNGKCVLIIDFSDEYLFVDLDSQQEINRISRKNPVTVEEGIIPKLADRPKIKIDENNLSLSFPRWYEFGAKTIKYSR